MLGAQHLRPLRALPEVRRPLAPLRLRAAAAERAVPVRLVVLARPAICWAALAATLLTPPEITPDPAARLATLTPLKRQPQEAPRFSPLAAVVGATPLYLPEARLAAREQPRLAAAQVLRV